MSHLPPDEVSPRAAPFAQLFEQHALPHPVALAGKSGWKAEKLRALTDRPLRGRLIGAGQARAAEHSWAGMAEGIREFVLPTTAANPANRGAWGKG